MLCKALSIQRNSWISRSVFCNASCVLTRISSTKDESSSRGMLSICKSDGGLLLSLLAALIDLSSKGGIVLITKNFSIVFIPPNLSLKVFGAKNLPVYFVKETHLSPL